MKWNRLFFVCSSSLLFLSFVGCKKTIRIGVDSSSLVPIGANVKPGATLEWVAISPGEKFDIKFEEPGLCRQKSPIRGEYGHPAICDVPPQPPGNPPHGYDYSIEPIVDGKPIPSQRKETVFVGPIHCPHCP